jgi:hypothetical protein
LYKIAMADSIDEFFAKKDKSKKGKAKSKYTTSETIAKKLEEGGKRPEPTILKKDIKDKIQISSNNQSIIIPSVPNDQEDDEWKDIETAEIDYSGLKIQALSISEKEKEEEQLKEQMLSEQNGDSVKQADGQTGPWNKPFVQHTPEVEKAPPEPVIVKEEPASKPVGTYKPPALRNSGSSASSVSSSKRYQKNAPPISSELDFPSLSSAVECNKWKMSEADSKTFQSVKHGVRSKGETQKELRLDLENKFSALPQEK